VRAVIAEKQYALDDILAMDEDQLKREFRREDYQKKPLAAERNLCI